MPQDIRMESLGVAEAHVQRYGHARRFLLRNLPVLLLVVLAGITTGTTFSTHDDSSPTADEVTHVVRGLSYWWTGDSRLSYAHPPLANLVAGAPGAASSPTQDFSTQKGWETADVNAITRAYAARDYAEARRVWLMGRIAMSIFPLALVAYLAWWCSRRWGPWIGVLPSALLLTHPTFLAHATLTTTDMPAACLLTIATCELVSLVEQRRLVRVLTLALALGLAAAAKFSAIFLLPLAAIVLVGVGLVGVGDERPLSRRLACVAGHVAVLTVGVTLVVNAVYGFQRTGWTAARILEEAEPKNPISASSKGELLEEESPLPRLPGAMPVPLPYSYVFGVFTIKKQTTGGHPRDAYFMGERRREGFVSYFPTLLVLKSPLGFVAAFFAALVVLALRRGRGMGALWVMGAVGGVYLAMVMVARLNIGVRHALPLLPIAAILGAAGLACFVGTRWQRAAGVGAAVVVAAQLVTVVIERHDYLGYFNAAAGGPAGERHVSVIGEDWGQDVRRLGREIQRRELGSVAYKGIGHTSKRELALLDVRIAKLTCKPPRTEWVALHESHRVRNPDCYDWLPAEPDVWIENHIGLYRVPRADRSSSAPIEQQDEEEE